MINDEIKVIECTVSTFEGHLNEMSNKEWDLVDWRIDFPTGKIVAIFCRSFSTESVDWFNKLEAILQKLEEMKKEE